MHTSTHHHRSVLTLASVVFLVVATAPLSAAPASASEAIQSRFGPLTQFIGHWRGAGSGLGGDAAVTYDVEPVVADQFIQWHVESVTLPTKEQPKGDVHRDIAMISYDEPNERFVLRQFLSEGYVNTYVLAPIEDEHGPFVFESVDVEGMAEGWRVRLTYTFDDANTFTWHLELAGPGNDYFQCRTGQMQRSE